MADKMFTKKVIRYKIIEDYHTKRINEKLNNTLRLLELDKCTVKNTYFYMKEGKIVIAIQYLQPIK